MPLRITVFSDRPDHLLVYAPDGAVMLPTLYTPFDRGTIASAFKEAGLDVRIVESIPGRWASAMVQAQRDERAEAHQRQNLREAADAVALRNSPNLDLKERSELVLKKQEVDESIRIVKVKIGEAKSNAFTRGIYMDKNTFRQLERRVVELKQESQAIQARLGELRKREKDANRAEYERRQAGFLPNFIRVAKEVLDAETFQELSDAASEAALEEETGT